MTDDLRVLLKSVSVWAVVAGWSVLAAAQISRAPMVQQRAQVSQRSCLDGAKDTLTFDGTAQAATQETALADARNNATDRAMACVAEVLFTTPGYAAIYGAQAIGDYVRNSGRVIDSSASADSRAGAGGFRGFVRFELKRGYFDISTIRELAVKPVPEPTMPWGFSLLPVRLIGYDGTNVEIPTRAGRPREGSFTFAFNARRLDGGSLSIRLDSIRVIEDGSSGTTRWSFDVFANGGAPAFTVPETRYDDRVGRYAMPRDRSVETTVRIDNAGWVELRVLGHRHEPVK